LQSDPQNYYSTNGFELTDINKSINGIITEVAQILGDFHENFEKSTNNNEKELLLKETIEKLTVKETEANESVFFMRILLPFKCRFYE
jgi:hypothetical protein